MKYLVLAVIVLIAIAWLRQQGRRSRGDSPPQRPPDANPAASAAAAPQDMVRCARCGLHVPAADAVTDAAGRTYCCVAHRDPAAT